MNNIVIVNQNGQRYLFSVPDGVELKQGENVKCDTTHGITDGVCWCDSLVTDDKAAEVIGKLLGAKFPLKGVVGRKVESVERFDAPNEAKPEPIKLYCVKSYEPGNWMTKGKIYEADQNMRVKFDDGYEETFGDEPFTCTTTLKDYLVPLVKRPAKVGEWVLMVRDDCVGINKKGSIARVIKRVPDEVWLYDPTGKYPGGISASHSVGYYLVLDGYDGRYEEPEKPKYWSGKVVCVDNEGNEYIYTVGKVYTIKDGVFVADDGKLAFGSYMVKDFADFCEQTGSKFIEFKGEANAK